MQQYSVLLVDDEEDVIRVIMKKIDWERMGFTVVGYAHNGVEALEMVEECVPDVVLTDIKMPYMDGLAMSRKLKERYQNIKIIIFSGFDEFEYAKEAIDIEVEQYLLKPVNAEELDKVFSRIRETLDHERDEQRNIDKLNQYYMESLPLLQESFYTSLIEGRVQPNEMEKYLEKPGGEDGRDTILDFYFSVRHFLNMYERVDEHYRIYTELLPSGEFVIRLYCVNPIENLAQCLSQGKAAIFFSATLLPLRYYRMLLSDQEEDYTVYVPSPFPQERRLLLAATDVTSRYTRRNETEYRRVLHYIQAMASAKKGNYIVFFPSYQYMNRVREVEKRFGKTGKSMEVLIQDSHMTEEEREAFLQKFSPERTAERDTSLVAFCVMGGLFSEGIDLTGDRLIGVIVVGTGLPMGMHGAENFAGIF